MTRMSHILRFQSLLVMFYGRTPSSSPVPADVSPIPDSWHLQRHNHHVRGSWRELSQAKDGMHILPRKLL